MEIWRQVYLAVRESYDESLGSSPELRVISSPGVTPAMEAAVLDGYRVAFGFWSKIFEIDSPPTLVLVTHHEEEWYTDYAQSVAGNYFDSQFFKSQAKAAFLQGGPMPIADGSYELHLLIGADAEHWTVEGAVEDPILVYQRLTTAIHETTHFFQFTTQTSGVEACRPETDWSETGMLPLNQRTCTRDHMPCWFHEGQASLHDRAFGYGMDPEFAKGLRQTRLNGMTWPYPDADSFEPLDWMKLLRYLRTVPVCVGDASSPVIAYALGLAVMEIMSHDFGESRIHEWMRLTPLHPSSRTCPAWVPAFEEAFGMPSDQWFQESAVPYLIEVFGDPATSSNQQGTVSIPPTPLCADLQPPEGGEWPTASGTPTGPEPVIGCGRFESQSEAQAWFDYFSPAYGDLGGLDANLDGIACGSNVGDRVPRVDLESYGFTWDSTEGWGGQDLGETVGVRNGILATCGSFLTPNDAQTWFDANPDFGESVDGNGDGTACGDGDFGGATDCNGAVQELVLPQFCPDYQYGPSGEDS